MFIQHEAILAAVRRHIKAGYEDTDEWLALRAMVEELEEDCLHWRRVSGLFPSLGTPEAPKRLPWHGEPSNLL